MQNDTETENSETHLAASRPAKRVWFAVLSLLVAPGLILWAVFNEAYFRHWIYAAAPVFSLFLVALWWSLLIENPWAKKRRRLVIVFGLATGFGLLVAILVRPDGSHDGSSPATAHLAMEFSFRESGTRELAIACCLFFRH